MAELWFCWHTNVCTTEGDEDFKASPFSGWSNEKYQFILYIGAGALLNKDMGKERWVAVQSQDEKETYCSHDHDIGGKAPHVAKPPILTCARAVAMAEIDT